jgi:hypothetical protein
MKLRQKLKELENETSAVKGILYEALSSLDRVLTRIEQLMKESEDAQCK